MKKEIRKSMNNNLNKKKLWETTSSLNPLVENFTIGDDYLLDQELLPYDIKASIAHCQMLNKIGVLESNELDDLIAEFDNLLELYDKGKFIIQKSQEDGHTAIEQYMTDKLGDLGKKIHTGRSRNDQSLVMIRLFARDSLGKIDTSLNYLLNELSKKVELYEDLPMPGYTHLQKAMPTSVGVWLDSFQCAFKDFKPFLLACQNLIDQNPLGSASGFGISNFDVDKEFTANELGFSKVQENPLYCGFSRGYFENIILQSLSQVINISAKFANDMLIFTTSEFDFFSLPNSFTTGSSIMPQKRNYDLFEIMRGNSKVFASYQNQINDIISSIGSGYQRDLQLTKKPFMQGIEITLDTIDLLNEIIINLQVNKEKLKQAMSDDLFVTNKVYDLVNSGMSFRQAYIEVKLSLDL